MEFKPCHSCEDLAQDRVAITSKLLSPAVYHLPDMVLEFVAYLLDPQPRKESIIE